MESQAVVSKNKIVIEKIVGVYASTAGLLLAVKLRINYNNIHDF